MKRFLSLFVSVLCAVGAWAQNTHNGHEYVDLGLPSHTLWATCNVNASAPERVGSYYSWGEIETRKKHDWATYKWMDNSKNSWNGCTKYTIEDNQTTGVWYDSEGKFIGDGLTELEDADDVAAQTWGGSWRMPTADQQTELIQNCYWVWTDTYNGVSVKGHIVYKAKKAEDKGEMVDSEKTPSSDYDVATDAHIFIPAAGKLGDDELFNPENGYYWSRSLYKKYSDQAYELTFSSGTVVENNTSRNYGKPVRPVYVAPIAQITIGEETTKYTDVEEFLTAFYAIDGEATVKLLDDITLSNESQFENTNADADITLDLNGHNIIGSSTDDGVIYKKGGKLTIEGDGIVENTGDEGDAVGSGGTVVINEGTYIGVLDACFVTPEATMVINGGKFKAPNLHYGGDCINPIVKGGIFSMDPSDCLAVGYEVVENDDEETKGEYPYKVVESDVDITNPAGLLAVPQAGELDIKAYFTAPQEMMYSFVILHGEYRNLNDALENSSQEDVVYGNKPKIVATVPQAISVKDANIALEDGETYTIVVYGNPVIFDGQGSMFEIAIIPFTVGVGEINTIETISVAAGKLDIKASFSVSDEDLEAGATYMYALFEGKYASFIQLMSVEPDPVIDSEKITIKSDTENITLSSDEVELEAGKDYTLLIFDPTRQDPAIGGEYPVVYAIINYTAVDNSTPTAIEGIDAPAAQKAVKTIENGKVVIIRGDKKYDLSGREL